jgi:hypothetical protein
MNEYIKRYIFVEFSQSMTNYALWAFLESVAHIAGMHLLKGLKNKLVYALTTSHPLYNREGALSQVSTPTSYPHPTSFPPLYTQWSGYNQPKV